MSLLGRIGQDLVHPFGLGNAPQQPVRTPAPQAPVAQRPIIRTPGTGIVQQFTTQLPHLVSGFVNSATLGQSQHIGQLAQNAYKVEGNAINQGIQHLPQPVARPVANIANTLMVKPLLQTGQHSAQLLQNQNPYHGTNRQQIGQIGGDIVNIASALPIGKAAEGAKLLATGKMGGLGARTIQAAKTGAAGGLKYGAGFGGAQGLTSSMAQNQNLNDTLNNAFRSAIIGGASGAALGGVGGGVAPTIGAGARVAGKGIGAVTKGAKVTANKLAQVPEVIAHNQLVKTDPYYRTYSDQGQQLQTAFDRNAANGLSPNHPTQIQLGKQIAQLNTKTADMRQAMLQNAKDTAQRILPGKGVPLNQTGSAPLDSPLMPGNKLIANAAEKLQGKSLPKAPAVATAVPKKIVSSKESITPFTHDPAQATFKGLQPSKEFPNSYHPAKLGDVLDYPALFKAHPELKDYTLKYHDVGDTPGAYEGVHNPKAKTISLDKSLPDAQRLPMLMHEVQHAIQGKEGRLDGTSSSAKLGYHGYKDNPIEVEARKVGDMYKPKTTAVAPAKPKTVLPGAAKPVPQPASKLPGAGRGKGSLGKNKTGVVDKQLNQYHAVRKQILDAEVEKVLGDHNAKLPTENLYKKILASGGISTKSADFAELPDAVKRTTGLPIDTVAKEAGYPDEHALYEDLLNYRDRTKPITKAEAQKIAQANLEKGTSEYTSDWKDIHKDIAQRTDELAQYPNGKYRQVKVTTNPQKMTDAELQSLSQTPEGVQPKTTNKVLQQNPKTILRNADADREVQDVLRKGGTTDEALNSYMKATGVDLQTAVKDVRRVAQESQLGFNGGKNPLEGTIKLPQVQAGDKDQAFLNADYVKQHEQATGQKALDAFHSLSEHDKTLLQDIEKDTVPNVAKRADNPEAFSAAEEQIRTYYDTRHAYDKALGIDVGYRANYLRQLFAKAEDQAKLSQPEQVSIKAGNKRPGYTQKREYDTLNTHVGDALERDIAGSSTNHAKLAYAKGLEEAFPEKTNTSGQLVRGDEGNYLQLTNKYGQGVTASPEIAKSINVRTHPGPSTGNLNRYDKLNAGLKQVKLGGGAFHAVTEAGTFVGQQIASGKIFKEPKASADVFRSFFSPKFVDSEMGRFRDSGVMDKAALSGLKIMGKDILADADVSLMNKGFKYTGIKALHDATFQRELPFLKLKTFEQKTKNLDIHKPADLAKMRDISKGINDEIGGLNRDIEGAIKPATFQRTQRFLLATDFTEGKVRTIMSALTKGGEQGRLAREIVVGKALLFGGLTVAGGAAFGDYKNKTTKQNAAQIAKSLIDPTFKAGRYSVALPNTYASEFIRPFEPLFKSKNGAGQNASTLDRVKGFQKYGVNRLAAVPSEALQLLSNKDASGNRIYGKDYKFKGGNPISPAKTALNVGGGFVPIPASQGIGVATGKTAIAPAIANVAGLRVSNEDAYNQAKSGPVGTTPVDKLKASEKAANKQLKASLSPEDQKLSTLSKTDRQKLINDGSYTQAKFDGLDNYVKNQKNKLGLNTINTSKGIAPTISPDSKKLLTQYNALSSADRTKKSYGQSNYDYQIAKAKYENDKASGKLSKAADISAQDNLAKAAVGQNFSRDVRELYGLNKNDIYDFVTSDPNGQKYADQLTAYDKALRAAGINSTEKFKYGFGSKSTGGSYSAGKKASTGKSALASSKVSYSGLKLGKAPKFNFKNTSGKGSSKVTLAKYKDPTAVKIRKPKGAILA